MANIPENTTNPILRPVTQLEITNKVFGGTYIPDDSQQRGISNLQAIELAERDQYIISRVGQAAVPESGDIPAEVGIAPLDTSGKLPKSNNTANVTYTGDTQTLTNKTMACADNHITTTAGKVVVSDANGYIGAGSIDADKLASIDGSQTLTNKTFDGADNTIKCTPTTISANTTLNPTKEMYVVVDTANVTITLGTAPYDGYTLPIMSVSGNSCKVTYSYDSTTITDLIWGAQPTTYIYIGTLGWRIAEGSTLRLFTADAGVNDWRVYRGNGSYNFAYSGSSMSSTYSLPASYVTVLVTWVSGSSASAICVGSIHSAGNEGYPTVVWFCNYASGTWSDWTKLIGGGSGSTVSKTSLSTGFSGTVQWIVQNGICTLTSSVQCTSTGTGKTVLTSVPKAKITCYAAGYANRGSIYISGGGTTLYANVTTASVNILSTLVYFVADDWVEP